ncbi:RhoGAP domain protein [Ancylostoma duodenale]|uniref:RhoGAP domain protein n=1 Tax=Ancylostoma duodenale TaxID=51022 RepID=A0A0C2GYN0_9BILA|nr:RhoGAP domain protein [Ancylostoma duodenale]
MIHNIKDALVVEDFDAVCLDDVQVHVLTTLVKSFLRELPEPLITFDLYENFLNVSEVDDGIERGRCLAVMIDLLPKSNRGLLDRLMFHLARVAHQVSLYLFSALFCISNAGPGSGQQNGPLQSGTHLRALYPKETRCRARSSGSTMITLRYGSKRSDSEFQEQLNDVTRQAICVQTLIEEKLRQYKATMINIVEIEDASQKVSANLRRIEEHQKLDAVVQNVGPAKQLFEEQLDFLGRQK